jgi:uncharacterized protein YdeI (YjbR/CyaY-like superfamily)
LRGPAQPRPEPIFFASPEEFYAWLEEHHASATEVYVGYWKKHTGKPSLTWSQAVDQALCFGWIDTRLNRIDEDSHMQRFTPRKPGSNWSKINVEKVARLSEAGLMRPAGIAAYEQRRADKTGVYSFERDQDAALPPEMEERFKAHAAAWEFFESQAPWYRRTAIHLVVSAKRPETRERRLAQLIEDSAAGRRLKQLSNQSVSR